MKLNPLGKIEFPGFQKVFDFTSAGGEASTTCSSVNSDIDKEYIILQRNLGTVKLNLQFNGDTGSNYGCQYLDNSAGSITAARNVGTFLTLGVDVKGLKPIRLITPKNLIKMAFLPEFTYSSGTTMSEFTLEAWSWNSTASITSMSFTPNSSTIVAGTRILIYARRSN